MKLEVRGVSKSFGAHVALQDVDLALEDIRALVLIGPSGGGKSTLLRVLAGLERPDSGSVRLDGCDVDYSNERSLRAHRRSLGVVFQTFNLFPHLSALRNITLPLEVVHGMASADAEARAREILDRFNLGEHARKKPAEMSGGQRQRVAIARAVSIRPKLLLCDEPTSALDPEMTSEVLDLICELREEGLDAVVVTHQMGFAKRVSGQVVFLAGGRVIESAPSGRFFAAPETSQARDFLARILKY